MRLQILAGALALAGSSAAFSDSSPWVLLSTAAFPDASNNEQIQTNSHVLQHTKKILSECPTDRYLLITQPGANAGDLQGTNGCAVPPLCRAVDDSRINGRFIVSEVISDAGDAELYSFIKTACTKKDKTVDVAQITLSPLTSDRVQSLAINNEGLGHFMDTLISQDSYTILYVGSPGEPTYEPDFVEPVRMDLKRHFHGQPELRKEHRKDNRTEWDKAPLFEKYQFFTPGIFMGIIVAIVLFSILGVGLRALASLEVSYGAFEKDMSPAAQKKQQ
ncbi:hypothetical protein G7046_g8614 [Stylonectria norvegica]|nr:hypothetical protein G7046_g8614 [Stylonectria norvegica]